MFQFALNSFYLSISLQNKAVYARIRILEGNVTLK